MNVTYHHAVRLSAAGADLWRKYDSYRPGIIRSALDEAGKRNQPCEITILDENDKPLFKGRTNVRHEGP